MVAKRVDDRIAGEPGRGDKRNVAKRLRLERGKSLPLRRVRRLPTHVLRGHFPAGAAGPDNARDKGATAAIGEKAFQRIVHEGGGRTERSTISAQARDPLRLRGSAFGFAEESRVVRRDSA